MTKQYKTKLDVSIFSIFYLSNYIFILNIPYPYFEIINNSFI